MIQFLNASKEFGGKACALIPKAWHKCVPGDLSNTLIEILRHLHSSG